MRYTPIYNYKTKDYTLTHVHLNGSKQVLMFKTHFTAKGIRILLTNIHNPKPLRVRYMNIMINGVEYPVELKGLLSFSVAAYSECYSDEIKVNIEHATAMVVTTRFKYFTTAYSASDFNSTVTTSSSHYGIFNQSMILGLKTKAISKPHLQIVALVKQVEALSEHKSITWFGDSLTNHAYYTQVLQEKLIERQEQITISNAGHSGNRLLRPGKGIYKYSFGNAGVDRIDDDVFKYNKPDMVVVALGVNDLIHPGTNVSPDEFPSFEEMIEGYRYLLSKIKDHGAKAVICTITQFKGYKITILDEAEVMRNRLNEWIKTESGYDMVIDLSSMTEDKRDPSRLDMKFESDDCLHWNQVGGEIIANQIDLDSLLNLLK